MRQLIIYDPTDVIPSSVVLKDYSVARLSDAEQPTWKKWPTTDIVAIDETYLPLLQSKERPPHDPVTVAIYTKPSKSVIMPPEMFQVPWDVILTNTVPMDTDLWGPSGERWFLSAISKLYLMPKPLQRRR